MAQTYIPPNTASPNIVPRIFSAKLFTESLGDSFFIGRFASEGFRKYGDGSLVGTDPSAPIQIIRDLEKTNGDTIQYDLVTEIRGDAVYGDNRLKGKEKNLSFGLDQVHIDQVRQAIDIGGRMTRKRTKHDLRLLAKDRLRRYFSRFYDEALVCYLAGLRGDGTNQWVLPTTWSGFGGNALQTPDTAHGVTVDSSGDISHTKTDATGFTLSWLDKLERYITTMDVPPNPIMVGGEPKYVLVLSPYAVEQMKADTTAKSWIEIQKHAGVRGEGNYIYKGALGSYGMFVLHSYSKIPTTTVSSSVYCHNLLLGAQAAVVGFGDAGGKFSFSWNEEIDDYGNLVGIAGASILGIKKCRFDLDNTDFGALTVWTKN